MVTLCTWSDDPFDHDHDKLSNLVIGIVAAALAIVLVTTIAMGIVGLITGTGSKSSIDPNTTVTYNGQVFGHFQREEINEFYGVAERVRGKPLQTDQLWSVLPARDEITIDGLVYGDCEGVGPVVKDRLRYRELVCKL